ncbi:MAG: glycosyltransferase family protein [Candidatus Omnitrophica bacterium]|nr:glycosyltransferase family protein [Candidatus Omnitrophota bacterium]
MSKKDKIVATIEARMSSSRLPGKVLMPADGKPMLAHLLARLRAVPSLDEIVLATTVNRADEPLIQFAKDNGIASFRGSEEDVMGRVIGAAGSANADLVVEITGDCPIIDPAIVEEVIQLFLNNDCDYATNAHIRSYPDGMDTQVFRLDTLKRSYEMTDDIKEREHVTLHIRRHPELFRHMHLEAPGDMRWPELGLTLDTHEDYSLLKQLIEHFGSRDPLFSCKEAVAYLRKNPDLLTINRHVKRKGDK